MVRHHMNIGNQDASCSKRPGYLHDAGEEVQDGEAAIYKVDKVGIMGLQVECREYCAACCDGARIEAVHQGHKSDDAKDADYLVERCGLCVNGDSLLRENDQSDLHSSKYNVPATS